MATIKDKTNPNYNDTLRSDLFRIDPRNIVVKEGFNVRRDFSDIPDFAKDIAKNGVLNPITVSQDTDAEGNVVYTLVDGERRYRATMYAIEYMGAEIQRIPAIKQSRSMTEEESCIAQVKKNEGKPFTDYEYGLMFVRFRDVFGRSQAETAEKFDKNQAYVSMCLGLTELAPEIQESLANNEISASTVTQIVRSLDNESAQVTAVTEAVENAKAKGKTKATGKDIVSEEVRLKKDSKAVLTGLNLLVSYMEQSGLPEEAYYTLNEIAVFLADGRDIADVLTNCPSVRGALAA
jgi:ParB family chromosome partitioning protein